MDEYLAADAADTLAVNDHNNQLGKKFATIKQHLEDFLENNLYSKNHNDSVKAAKAAAQADRQDRVGGQPQDDRTCQAWE